MKKVSLSFLFLLIFGFTQAQIAQWTIPPVYDNLQLAPGNQLIEADSANAKVLFNLKGQRLFTTTETLNPFSDGCAVLSNDEGSILSIYDASGKLLTSFNNPNVKIANDYPYYSNGYLIVKKNRYYFVDKYGVVDKTQHLRVYPFHNGYAVCQDYENPERKTGIVNYLVDAYKKEVPMVYKGKVLDPSDIQFVSSVNDEKIAFVIINKMVYIFNANARLLSPLYFQNSSNGKPKQAKLQGELPESFDKESNIIYAQCGKDEQIALCFNKHLIPTEISYNGEKKLYEETKKEAITPKSSLTATKEGNLFGLSYNEKAVLPAQFNGISCCIGDQAIAELSGKQGLLKVVGNIELKPYINEDKSIGFRHQSYETTIRIDMPASFNPAKLDFLVNEDSGFIVDKLSKKTNVTADGNRAEFSCKLFIPSTVTEETAEFDYPIQMSYDNIKLMPINKKVKAWRDNYYEVIILDKEKVYDKKNGVLVLPYSVTMERLSTDVPTTFELEVTPDDLEAELQQTSTTQGTCVIPVTALEEGENYIFIELTEEGCPPISFPYTITFNKKGKKQPVKTDFIISKTITEFE